MTDSTDHTDWNARLREMLEGLRDDPDAQALIIAQALECLPKTGVPVGMIS